MNFVVPKPKIVEYSSLSLSKKGEIRRDVSEIGFPDHTSKLSELGDKTGNTSRNGEMAISLS